MYLKSISQKLVDATMEIIDNRNINIMDKNGFIIASGEKSRINTFHKGAEDVIKSNKFVEIYPEDVKDYPGAKEGINMPINIQGKVLGVVGVGGHPDEVRIVTKLVKASIELAFEQYLISEELKIVKDLKQQIIRKIIYENTLEKEEEILCLCKIANLDGNKNRIAIIIKIQDDNKEYAAVTFKSIRKIEKYIQGSEYIQDEDIAAVINESFVIFKTIPLKGYKNENDYMKQLSKKVYEKCGLNIKIACGSLYKTMHGLKKSFYEAKSLIKSNSKFIQDINDINIQSSYLLNQIDSEKIQHFIKPIYDRFLNDDGKIEGWVVDTLNALFENNLNINDAAKQLYLHKNSLIYRIKKIEKISGLSIISNFNHSILLKLLIIYMKK